MKDMVDLRFLIEKRYENIGIIDVRSENEFMDDHLPNAVNIPLLNNEERAIVGTIYKQIGPKEARFKGVSIVSPKLEDFINKIKGVADLYKDCIIYCWRGGLRSEASVTFARLAGITVSRLSGGYKTYRNEVIRFINEDIYKYRFITVYGPTGSAKTKILELIDSEQYPFLNLEKYASHKGSSFGHIEEKNYPFVTQKNFESKIYYKFISHINRLILTEGESKRIGKVVIPPTLFDRMINGIGVLFNPPLEFRIDFTVKNYNPSDNIPEIRKSLENIKRYIHPDTYNELLKLLDNDDFSKFTEILLVKYYDPLYKNSYKGKASIEIRFNSIEEGAKKIKEFYDEIVTNNRYTDNIC